MHFLREVGSHVGLSTKVANRSVTSQEPKTILWGIQEDSKWRTCAIKWDTYLVACASNFAAATGTKTNVQPFSRGINLSNFLLSALIYRILFLYFFLIFSYRIPMIYVVNRKLTDRQFVRPKNFLQHKVERAYRNSTFAGASEDWCSATLPSVDW